MTELVHSEGLVEVGLSIYMDSIERQKNGVSLHEVMLLYLVIGENGFAIGQCDVHTRTAKDCMTVSGGWAREATLA